jgi:hypothetical protein
MRQGNLVVISDVISDITSLAKQRRASRFPQFSLFVTIPHNNGVYLQVKATQQSLMDLEKTDKKEGQLTPIGVESNEKELY